VSGTERCVWADFISIHSCHPAVICTLISACIVRYSCHKFLQSWIKLFPVTVQYDSLTTNTAVTYSYSVINGGGKGWGKRWGCFDPGVLRRVGSGWLRIAIPQVVNYSIDPSYNLYFTFCLFVVIQYFRQFFSHTRLVWPKKLV